MILLVDFGLVVLIWIVQLIVYPTFFVIAEDDFAGWHQRYTRLISYIVGPLMLAQMGLHAYGLYTAASAPGWVAALFIAGAWIVTFSLSVPCHNTLASQGKSIPVIQKLIRTNWVRTVFWSCAFFASWIASGTSFLAM